MRLKGPEPVELEGEELRQRPGAPDAEHSAADLLAEIHRISAALKSQASPVSKFRARLKIRWHVLSVSADRFFKRGLDVAGSLAAIILLLPLFTAVAIWIKLDSPGPLIYRQVRVGQYGRPFYFYKFRSMYTDSEARRAALERENESADGVIFKMKNDPRITRCGRFIRKYSIDEAPQFFNVLLGDMSLVGPRPPLPAEATSRSASRS